MEEKRIVILLATHNSGGFLREQLDSLKNQTYKNIEILASDDCSEDNTVEILDTYGIKHISKEGGCGSAQANFMYLIENALDADYYMFCDHDDVWLPEKTEKTYKRMLETEGSKPCLIHTDLRVVDGSLQELFPSMRASQQLERLPTLENALAQSSVTGCTVMINRSLLLLAQRKRDAADIIMHDWFLTLLALCTGKIGYVDEPLILYRQHSGNEVGAKNVKSAGYILSRAKNNNKNKKIIEDTFVQAQMLYSLYGDCLGERAELVKIYGEMLNKGKLQRLALCRKYGFWKNTFVRRAAQIIYM